MYVSKREARRTSDHISLAISGKQCKGGKICQMQADREMAEILKAFGFSTEQCHWNNDINNEGRRRIALERHIKI